MKETLKILYVFTRPIFRYVYKHKIYLSILTAITIKIYLGLESAEEIRKVVAIILSLFIFAAVHIINMTPLFNGDDLMMHELIWELIKDRWTDCKKEVREDSSNQELREE